MAAITDGIVTTLNGVVGVFNAVLSPVGAAIAAISLSAAWLAMIEVELMDRSAAKPRVGRH